MQDQQRRWKERRFTAVINLSPRPAVSNEFISPPALPPSASPSRPGAGRKTHPHLDLAPVRPPVAPGLAIGEQRARGGHQQSGDAVDLTPCIPNGKTSACSRVCADELPKCVTTVDELLSALFTEAKVDGLFTDFPDLCVKR